MKPFGTTRLENPPSFEALRLSEVLDQLPGPAPDGPDLADEKYLILKSDPRHPSPQLKLVGRFWSCRIGLHHRTLGIDVEGGILWFWIGDHAQYDRLVD